jgi:hypothetical protein
MGPRRRKGGTGESNMGEGGEGASSPVLTSASHPRLRRHIPFSRVPTRATHDEDPPIHTTQAHPLATVGPTAELTTHQPQDLNLHELKVASPTAAKPHKLITDENEDGDLNHRCSTLLGPEPRLLRLTRGARPTAGLGREPCLRLTAAWDTAISATRSGKADTRTTTSAHRQADSPPPRQRTDTRTTHTHEEEPHRRHRTGCCICERRLHLQQVAPSAARRQPPRQAMPTSTELHCRPAAKEVTTPHNTPHCM